MSRGNSMVVSGSEIGRLTVRTNALDLSLNHPFLTSLVLVTACAVLTCLTLSARKSKRNTPENTLNFLSWTRSLYLRHLVDMFSLGVGTVNRLRKCGLPALILKLYESHHLL